jgi:hypothetical protein
MFKERINIMKKTLLMVVLLVLPALLFAQGVVNTTHNGTGPYFTIQAAINNAATVNGDVITVAAGVYNENVVVNKSVTINGVGTSTILNPGAAGIGVTVTVNNVTLTNFKVSGFSDHGIYAGNVSGLTITSITSMGNGTGATKRSGIALQGVTGTSVLTNVTSTGNGKHGLEIGNGSNGVNVDGGSFIVNGVDGDISTGAGIIVYADAGKTTCNTVIDGITANTNKTAGIYVYCATGGTVSSTTIGGTTAPTLNDNGSMGGAYGNGGAAVLVFGPCSNTTITANSTNSGAVVPTAGLVILGAAANGTDSPTGTVAKGCTLSGFSATSPAATMYAISSGSVVRRCTTDVIASGTPYNTINGIGTGAISLPADGYTVETLLYHKVDDVLLGRFVAPGNTIYVPTGGSINNGIASAAGYTTVQVQAGTYTQNVNVNKAITLSGDGATTIVTPASGIGINVTIAGVTISNLRVTGAASHGVWASGVSNLHITNVTADGNGTGGTGSGVAVRGITGTSAITNVTAINNTNHGLQIGNATNGLQVVGGTFSTNGTIDNLSTGGGITLYSDASGLANEVQNVVITGSITANTNKTAGIYIYSTPGKVIGTSIGQTGGDVITLTDNGSTNTIIPGIGGAGVLVYGAANLTNITSNFTLSAVNGAGLVVLGEDGAGTNSPTNLTLSNSVFTGYTATYPAITLASSSSSPVKISNVDINATTGNTITGGATVIFDKTNNPALGKVVLTNGLLVKVKVFLQGPFSGASMTTTLATNTLIPITQTYSAAPFSYSGAEAVSGTSFFTTNTVVDWVLVQLRNTTTNVVETRAGLLKSDGTVIDVDATEGLLFTVATAGDYYIVVKHRNHLAVMSAAVVTLPNATAYDFTTALTQAYGATTPMKDLTGTGPFGMWCGDTDASGSVVNGDRDNTWNNRNLNNVYMGSDTDLSGSVVNADRDNTWNNRNLNTQVP